MRDYTGHARVRYEDVFRAIGNYLDAQHFSTIVIVETPEGFLIKAEVLIDAQRSDAIQTVSQTYLFSNADIDALVEAAYQRRQEQRPDKR